MTKPPRKPAAFTIEPSEDSPPPSPEPEKAETPKQKPGAKTRPAKRAPRALPAPEIVDDTGEGADVQLPALAPERVIAPAFRWLPVLAMAVTGIATLWISVTIIGFVEDLFKRHEILGWAGTGLLAAAGLALLAIISREIVGLARLSKLGALQEKAASAVTRDDARAASETLEDLIALYRGRPDTAWGRSRLKSHLAEVIDPKDRIALAERDLMVPLDNQADTIISRAARRVALTTAVTPSPALDILLVGAQNLRMLRELATLFGGRPGTVGTLRLARMVVSHLAVAGGLALTDGLAQQLIGKGLLGRLSTRFGEGAVNGLLTARIGIAAIELCRPLPFMVVPKPGMAHFLREITGLGSSDETPPKI